MGWSACSPCSRRPGSRSRPSAIGTPPRPGCEASRRAREVSAPRLGLWSTAALVVGHTIAVGIFLTPAQLIGALASPAWTLGLWLTCGAFVFAGALTFGELAARYPQSGGLYVYLREAFGPRAAFLYGWQALLVMDPGITAAIAVGLSQYLRVLWPAAAGHERAVAIAAICCSRWPTWRVCASRRGPGTPSRRSRSSLWRASWPSRFSSDREAGALRSLRRPPRRRAAGEKPSASASWACSSPSEDSGKRAAWRARCGTRDNPPPGACPRCLRRDARLRRRDGGDDLPRSDRRGRHGRRSRRASRPRNARPRRSDGAGRGRRDLGRRQRDGAALHGPAPLPRHEPGRLFPPVLAALHPATGAPSARRPCSPRSRACSSSREASSRSWRSSSARRSPSSRSRRRRSSSRGGAAPRGASSLRDIPRLPSLRALPRRGHRLRYACPAAAGGGWLRPGPGWNSGLPNWRPAGP